MQLTRTGKSYRVILVIGVGNKEHNKECSHCNEDTSSDYSLSPTPHDSTRIYWFDLAFANNVL